MCARRQLTDDFQSPGIAAGDVVMVHASVRAVGDVAGGPDEIHLALKDALTEDGTLVMYPGCPPVGDAWCHLLSARELLRFSRPLMERVAIDRHAADHLKELSRSARRDRV